MKPDDTTYSIEFKRDINLLLLNEVPYFSKAITWNYFNKKNRMGVFYTSENITTLHKKMADTLGVQTDDIVIVPHTDGLTNLYYGTV